MPIDVHAHYVPPQVVDALERESGRYVTDIIRLTIMSVFPALSLFLPRTMG